MSDPSLTRLNELRKLRMLPGGLSRTQQREHDELAQHLGLQRDALRRIDKGILAVWAAEGNTARRTTLYRMLDEDKQKLCQLDLDPDLVRRIESQVVRIHDAPPLPYDDQLDRERSWQTARS